MGPMVHHPLVISTLTFGIDRAHTINGLYEQKRATLARAREVGSFHRIVFLHERPYRLNALMDLIANDPRFTAHEDFWEIISQVWTDSENIWENDEGWRDILTRDIPNRHRMMTREEQGRLDFLGDTIRVFRGYSGEGTPDGLSWTTNREKAEWFADRFGDGEPIVVEGEVDRRDVIAYLMGRNECEVIALPEHVRRA
ncbi:MAG: hypothetical protein EOO77_35395 [Oxalobacteraceae bacterium]|nr:MAG: hypothetical protein EOO77_35395 [Oxalobacteraceae bacterium]